jgi:hypothetical protein
VSGEAVGLIAPASVKPGWRERMERHEHVETDAEKCPLCGVTLSAQGSTTHVCLRRNVNPIRYVELFWDEA